jgi:hypothetical protein
MTRSHLQLMPHVLLLVSAAACSSTKAFSIPTTPTAIASPQEQDALRKAAPETSGVTGEWRLWRHPELKVGLIKWFEPGARAVGSAPENTLRALRDFVGTLNRDAREGVDIRLAVNVYEWERPWYGGPPRAHIEVIGKDQIGQTVCLGYLAIRSDERYAESLADSHQTKIARAFAATLREGLGL